MISCCVAQLRTAKKSACNGAVKLKKNQDSVFFLQQNKYLNVELNRINFAVPLTAVYKQEGNKPRAYKRRQFTVPSSPTVSAMFGY